MLVHYTHFVLYELLASAESYLNEATAVYQSNFGPNHEKTIRCQDELVRLMIRTDRQEEAVQVSTCLKIK